LQVTASSGFIKLKRVYFYPVPIAMEELMFDSLLFAFTSIF
jgi:hypothetical protein